LIGINHICGAPADAGTKKEGFFRKAKKISRSAGGGWGAGGSAAAHQSVKFFSK